MRFHGRTDPGRRRANNEDAFVTSDADGFCVLCDGMGGHESGEVASQMAVEIFGQRLRSLIPEAGKRDVAELDRLKESVPELLKEWLRSANLAIYERGADDPGALAGRHMGTTVALLVILDGLGFCLHVGDSRIYRLRGTKLERLTRDHSITAPDWTSLVPSGRKRKYVTRALGTRPDVVPDVRTTDVLPGDRFLVCSDGLTDLVRDDEISETIRALEGSLELAPAALVDLANERGGRDNITAVLAAVEEASRPDDAADPSVLPPPPLEPPPPWDSGEREGA